MKFGNIETKLFFRKEEWMQVEIFIVAQSNEWL